MRPPPATEEVTEEVNVHSCLQVDRLVVGSRPLSVGERMNADVQITAVNTNNGVSSVVCQLPVAPLEGSFLQLVVSPAAFTCLHLNLELIPGWVENFFYLFF